MLRLHNVPLVTVTSTKFGFVATTAFRSSLISESVEICVELLSDRTRVNEKFEVYYAVLLHLFFYCGLGQHLHLIAGKLQFLREDDAMRPWEPIRAQRS